MKWFTFALLVVSLGMVGCGGGGGGGNTVPQTAKVSGTVTLDGKPMPQGEVTFTVSGQPPRTVEVKDGAFSGEAFPGKNRVEVSSMKDGPPNPMDKSLPPLKVNMVGQQYWGTGSTLSADIPDAGSSGLKFEVKGARR